MAQKKTVGENNAAKRMADVDVKFRGDEKTFKRSKWKYC